MFYAELDENNRCFHVTESELPLSERIVAVDKNVLGMIYNPEAGTFSEYTPPEPEPIPEPQLTETEQAILDTAINVDYLVCMKELEI